MRKFDKYDKFANRFITWIKNKGFVNTNRSWGKPTKEGLMFYSFVNEIFRFEIKLHWGRKYSFHGSVIIVLRDCKNEYWTSKESNCLMWMDQKTLFSLEKPFTKSCLMSFVSISGLIEESGGIKWIYRDFRRQKNTQMRKNVFWKL